MLRSANFIARKFHFLLNILGVDFTKWDPVEGCFKKQSLLYVLLRIICNSIVINTLGYITSK